MTPQEHVFSCLAEECAEVTQIASKINRFGLDDSYKPDTPLNSELLVKELNDILGVVALLKDMGVELKGYGDPQAILKKKEKIRKYMDYAHEVGTLQDKSRDKI